MADCCYYCKSSCIPYCCWSITSRVLVYQKQASSKCKSSGNCASTPSTLDTKGKAFRHHNQTPSFPALPIQHTMKLQVKINLAKHRKPMTLLINPPILLTTLRNSTYYPQCTSIRHQQWPANVSTEYPIPRQQFLRYRSP